MKFFFFSTVLAFFAGWSIRAGIATSEIFFYVVGGVDLIASIFALIIGKKYSKL